jgi:hypothetical protein
MHTALCWNCPQDFLEQVFQGNSTLAKEYLLGPVLQHYCQTGVWYLERHFAAF